MKNTHFNSILRSTFTACALTIVLLVLTQPVSAQSSVALIQVTIPFPFQTALQTWPAGKYRIAKESRDLIMLRGPGNASGFVSTSNAIKSRAVDHGTIVFHRVGDKFFLRQIWTTGSINGLECPTSHAEKASLLAANQQAPSSTEVAINGVPEH
jgi:hypothetical protein